MLLKKLTIRCDYLIQSIQFERKYRLLLLLPQKVISALSYSITMTMITQESNLDRIKDEIHEGKGWYFI
jgi:hypothetical protein